MDYSKFSKINNINILKEFFDLITDDEKLAIGYMDNLLGILLSKEIFKDKINLLFYSILHGKEKLVTKMIEKNVVDLNKTDNNGENAFFYAVTHRQYNIAIKILDTGLCRVNQENKDGHEAIDYIKFDNVVKDDPKKNEKLELFIKLLNYYIENDNTSQTFQSTIDFICSKPELINALNNKLKTKKTMGINVEKFKQHINLDKPELLCAAPISAEVGDLVNDLNIVSDSDLTSLKKAKLIKTRLPEIALPDTDEYFDENDYDSEEETEFLIQPREYPGGKNKSKKIKRKNKTKKRKNKTRNLR